MFFKKQYTEYYNDYNTLRIFFKEKDKQCSYHAFIMGVYQFQGTCHKEDLKLLKDILNLKENKGQIIKITETLCPIKNVAYFPLHQILFLFTAKHTQSNYNEFYQEILNALEKENIPEDEREDIIIENLIKNQKVFQKFFDNMDIPIYQWIFHPHNIHRNKEYIELIPYLAHVNENEAFFMQEYVVTESLTELFNYITHNKDFSFTHELKNFLKSHLTIKKGKIAFANYPLFEKIYILFSFQTIPSSFKEFKVCLERCDKITGGKEFAFLEKNLNLREHIKTFCARFQEDEIHVFKKLNIYFHLIEKKNLVLDKYYQKHKEVLSIKKEKKLEYFMDELSRRLRDDVEHFNFTLKNEGFNEEKINDRTENFSIKSIDSSQELFDVGMQMSNCAGNFEYLESYSQQYNFIVTHEDNIYLGFIKEGRFREFKGFKNSSSSLELMKQVFDYLYHKGYLLAIEDQKRNQDFSDPYEGLFDKECVYRLEID